MADFSAALTAYQAVEEADVTLALAADLVVAYSALIDALEGVASAPDTPVDIEADPIDVAALIAEADSIDDLNNAVFAEDGLAALTQAVEEAEADRDVAQEAYDEAAALLAQLELAVENAQADVDDASDADVAAEALINADVTLAGERVTAAEEALEELLDGASYNDAWAAAVDVYLDATADLTAATAANTAAQADLTAAQAASTAAQAALTAATATDTAAQAAKTAAETSLAALENAVSKYEQIVFAKDQIKLIETDLAALSKAVAEIAPVDALVATRKELTDAKTKALAGITELYDFNVDTTVAKNEVYTAPAANANITLGKGDLLYVGGYTFNEGSAAKDGDNSVLEFFIKQVAGGVEVTFEKSVFGSNATTADTVVVTLTGLTVSDLEIADGFIGFGG